MGENKKQVQVATRMTKAKKQRFREACETVGKEMSAVISEMMDSFIDDVEAVPAE